MDRNFWYIYKDKAWPSAVSFDASGRTRMVGPYVFAGGAMLTHVIYNEPATIAFWSDRTKTVVKCAPGDEYQPDIGLMLCVMKKTFGATSMKKLFKNWVPKEIEGETHLTWEDING